jgi:glycosyltransferase involved in cell wall biosynthesis
MKILSISNSISISETFIYKLSKGLSLNNDVLQIVNDPPFYKEGINFTVVNFEIKETLSGFLSYVLESRGKKILYNLRKRKASNKLIEYIKSSEVVYIDYGTNAARILPILIKLKKPFVVHFHGYDITSELNDRSYKSDLSNILEHANAVITASKHIKRLVVLNGCEESKVHVIRYGINVPNELDILDWKERKNDFIFVGRLTLKKNPIALILAFNLAWKKNSHINLHIVGDGPLKMECIKLCKKLNIEDYVKFHGALSNDLAIDLVKNSKVYVQHSVTPITGDQEGFAISLAEAASYKLPVVSTIHNGIPENVIDGITGLLVKEYDYEAMGEKMSYLINNSEIAIEMGGEGHEHIKSLCSNERRIEEVSMLLTNIVKNTM